MVGGSSQFGSAEQVASLFNAAVQHYGARRMQPAEQACRRVLEHAPQHAEALYLLGAMHMDRGDFQTAIGFFRRSAEANPQAAPARFSLAVALQRFDRLSESEAAFREAIRLRPEIAEAHLGLGRVLTDQGRPAEAEESFRNALVMNPGLLRPDNELGAAAQSFGLYISYRPISDLDDHHPEFKALLQKWVYKNERDNTGDISRLYTLILNIKQAIAEGVPGDMAELGVYRGNSAAVLAHYARSSGRELLLFDTFEGFDARDLTGVDRNRAENFSVTSLPEVQQLVGEAGVCYIKGYFPQSIPDDAAGRMFAVVHLDCDLYKPLKAGLEFFYPRLSPGGLLLVHDYSSGLFPGAKRAIDEFMMTIPENIVLQPDRSGTAAIRKSKSAH